MIKLYHRSDAKERIDDPHIDAKILRQTHQEINSINVCTFGYWPTMSAVKYFLARYDRDRVIKILDIGCGAGETLRRIDAYGRSRKLSLQLTGIDLNREAIIAAVDTTTSNINFIHGDILANDGNDTYDVIINSLTMHHLTNQEIVKLMRWMTTRARVGWFISDLSRHAIAYYFIKYFVKLRRFNPVICHDAPLSVARSFRRKEWADLLTQAELNLNSTKIFWYPNFRYGIRYEK
ncbi:MAG: methyltransferase domain-containing protein [Candidatus Doudnabacteria bacterium]|nr:methyltransferase domain-containing protein [Candidatus Omnitrophota bacterium]MDZ4243610.1 methyltransferase domain-containing protein [Candidatus Doudnabacteria bacterium]